MFLPAVSLIIYRVNQKIPQHENYDISEMRNFFVLIFAHLFRRQLCKSVSALCCIYLTYAKLTETQT